jgi:hypothetical protein
VPKGTGTGTGFAKTRGYATRVRVHLQNQPKNLATAVQVSIDTAMQRCEDRKDESVGVVQSMHRCGVLRSLLMVKSSMGLLVRWRCGNWREVGIDDETRLGW